MRSSFVLQEMATKNQDGQYTPKDVDKEYVVNFSILNEVGSFMLRDNLAKYLPSIPNLQYSTLAGTITSFQDQQNFYVINGKSLPVVSSLARLQVVDKDFCACDWPTTTYLGFGNAEDYCKRLNAWLEFFLHLNSGPELFVSCCLLILTELHTVCSIVHGLTNG